MNMKKHLKEEPKVVQTSGPFKPVLVWFSAIVFPTKTFRAQPIAASLVPAAKYLWFAGLLTSLAAFASVVGGESIDLSLILSLVGVLVIMPIALAVILGIIVLVLLGLSQLFGGRGSLHQHFHLVSIAIGIGFFFAYLLGAIAGGLPGTIGFIYGLYLLTAALKEAHQISVLRALAIWFVPSALAVLFLILYFTATGQVS